MYRVMLKTAVVDALRKAFTQYPVADLASPTIDIDYPVERASFPNIWVNYADTDPVRPVGLDSSQFLDGLPPAPSDPNATHGRYWRYLAQGTLTLTIGALSSLERDRLFDNLVRVIQMGRESESTRVFRDTLEQAPYANLSLAYDSLTPGGDNSAPGTPWGTDEMIYEISLSTDMFCEFFVEPTTGSLILLSQITVTDEPVTGFPVPPLANPGWIGQGTPADL